MAVANTLPTLNTHIRDFARTENVKTRQLSKGDGYEPLCTYQPEEARLLEKRAFSMSSHPTLSLLSLNASSLALNTTLTAIHYHIPRTTMDLYITNAAIPRVPMLGLHIFLTRVKRLIGESFERHHPFTPITNDYFNFKDPIAELRVYSYMGKVITWESLVNLICGSDFFILSTTYRSRTYAVEIEIEIDNDIVGHCSIWWTGS